MVTDKFDFKHRTIEPSQGLNNLKKSIEENFGAGAYITLAKYSIDIPPIIHTNFCNFSKEIAQ